MTLCLGRSAMESVRERAHGARYMAAADGKQLQYSSEFEGAIL